MNLNFVQLFEQNIFLIIVSFIAAMLWAPLLIKLLYKFKVVRKLEDDFSSIIKERQAKQGTPIMGGLLVILTVSFISTVILLVNEYEKRNAVDIIPLNLETEAMIAVPLFLTLLSSLLGGIDDLLNIFGKKRIIRTVSKHIKLAKVHKYRIKRIQYWLTLPINIYQNIWYSFGSYPGKGIHAGEKILFQLITGSLASWWLYFIVGVDSLWLPFTGDLYLGIFMIPFIIFVVMAMQNAVNITDGMDGLSAGLLSSSFLAFLMIALIQGQSEITYLGSLVIGSLLAYLYFNIKPARVEMGDVGSLGLGTLLAVYAFSINKSLLLLVISFPFILEVLSSMLQTTSRLILGRRIIKMAPLHYHFQIIGWSEEKIVMRAWLLGIVSAILGVWLGMQ
jgi:phospho-N-acetylmuramoyl-pentapeptide-transferase